MQPKLRRQDIVETLHEHSRRLVLGTALLFLAAGSLWAHMALGPVALEPYVWVSWLLVHGMSLLVFWLPARWHTYATVFSVLGLQLWFLGLIEWAQSPYLPVAPVFFLVSSLVLSTQFVGGALSGFILWILGWGSSFAWLNRLNVSGIGLDLATRTAFGVNLVFLGGFWISWALYQRRQKWASDGMAPSPEYDQAREQASKLQMLGTLTASVAHEINNPLAAIKGYVSQSFQELDRRGADGNINWKTVLQAQERIGFNAERIAQIVRVLKNYSRDGSLDEMTPVSLMDVIEDCVALMKYPMKSSNIDFRLHVPEEDVVIHGNFVELSQVLVNLLENARQACLDSGKDTKSVELGYQILESRVLLWVEDNGLGIDDSIAAKVFDSFFTTKPLGQGTGLGLSIARQIAFRHKGDLRFECPKDRHRGVLGTRFELDLPGVAASIIEDEVFRVGGSDPSDSSGSDGAAA